MVTYSIMEPNTDPEKLRKNDWGRFALLSEKVKEKRSRAKPAYETKITTAFLMSVNELSAAGYSIVDIATALGDTTARVKKALADERMETVAGWSAGILDPIEAARARYRLARAHEVITRSMDSTDRWLAFQAAQVIVAANDRQQDKTQSIQVVLHGDFMQDSVDDPALLLDDGDTDESDAGCAAE